MSTNNDLALVLATSIMRARPSPNDWLEEALILCVVCGLRPERSIPLGVALLPVCDAIVREAAAQGPQFTSQLEAYARGFGGQRE